MMNRTQASVAVAISVLMGPLAGVMSGQQPEQINLPIDPEVLSAFEQTLMEMSHPDYPVRENATSRLRRGGLIPLRMITQRLGAGGLHPETRARLISVGQDVFSRQPRAAMGIQFGAVVPDGVSIGNTIDGFDAQAKLLPGDVIVRADGERLTDTQLMREIIISHDPGQELALDVLRNGEPLKISVELGSFSDLGQQRLDLSTRRAAWNRRLARELRTPGGTGSRVEPAFAEIAIPVLEDAPGSRGQAGERIGAPGVRPSGADRLTDASLDRGNYPGVPSVAPRAANQDDAERLAELRETLNQLQQNLLIVESRIEELGLRIRNTNDPVRRTSLSQQHSNLNEQARELRLAAERTRLMIQRLER